MSTPPDVPRFVIDHGVIHDRVTGKHVRTTPDDGYEDGITACCQLLNDLNGTSTQAIERELRASGVDVDAFNARIDAVVEKSTGKKSNG